MNHFLLLTQSEQDQLLEEWTNTQTDYPQNATIHELFQIQAAQTPDAVAIAYKNQEITYHELDKKSNKLARYLQNIGVTTETLVALYLDRSPELIITILAILKAGGAYLPLDTSAPKNRIETILEDAQAPILITQNDDLSKLQDMEQDIEIICLDNNLDLTNIPNDIAADNKVNANNLSYVIYTSGSTGKPKGVCVLHRGVIRLVKDTNYAHFGSDEVILQLASIAFDAATFEIWAPLLNGGKLVLMPDKTPSLQEIGEVIKQYNVTTLWLTAGLFNLIVEEHIESLKPLRQLLAGGDVLSIPNVKKALKELPNCQLINGYGPTENTTFTCCHKITIDDTTKDSIPIGRPIANTQVYILNNDLQLVPIGITGELYIGGDGLAKGYLNQPHLTTESFIPNPFSNDPNSRLYKTGDRVRWNTEGNIEFLGRIDFQVKIRGYRVELGEIEAVLSKNPQIQSTIILTTEDNPNNKQIIAYIIPKMEINATELRNYLQNKLPDYMIPSEFIFIKEFPLNINGKIDRQQLLNLRLELNKNNKKIISPRTPIETQLVTIWTEILRQPVSIDNEFTQLGGNSLQAIQIISRIRDILGINLPVQAILKGSTITELATIIETEKIQENSLNWSTLELKRISGNGDFPLSLYQERMWLITQQAGKNPVYNLPIVFRLQGSLNIPILEKAINQLIQRHESLRTFFPLVDGFPLQRILSTFSLNLPVELISETATEKQIEQQIQTEINRPFQLNQKPPIRCLLLQLNSDNFVFIMVIHHMIADGWSLSIILQELSNLYNDLINNHTNFLPLVVVQYKDFSINHKQWLQNPQVYGSLVDYWNQKLKDAPSLISLPTDHPRPPLQTFEGGIQSFDIDGVLTQKLYNLSQQTKSTLYMILLGAFLIFLNRYSHQEDLVIGVPVANRNCTKVESIVGYFSNVIPLCINLSQNCSFLELLDTIKHGSLEAYTYQEFPVEQMLMNLGKSRDFSYTPWFQVVFNFLNVPPTKLELSGVKSFPLTMGKPSTLFDLMVLSWETPTGIEGFFEYNTNLFEASTIQQFIKHFKILLQEIIDDPIKNIHNLTLLTKKEQNLLLKQWNQTQSSYPHDVCIHQLFEEQVKRTPEAIAVIFEGQQISYQILNNKANQLAHYLQDLGLKSETLVGIYLENSIEMIVALLGILKAGCAYLPLEPGYPQERINYMLENANVSVLVSVRSLIKNLREYQGIIIIIDENKHYNFVKYQQNPNSNVKSNNLAYIIYTSGSTGTPKGVQIEHQSLINVLFSFKNQLKISEKDIWLAITTLCFDIAALEIFLPLITGAKLLLVSRQVARDGTQLLKTLNQSSATILQATPTTWQMLLLAGWQGSPQLTILTGGEALSQGLAKQLLSKGRHIYNVYGPTETTIWSLSDCITNDTEKITIGRPIANTQVYILDSQLQPVPIGIPGELYIGGDGLARGYLNRPELTTQKFINSPFDNQKKLYKTGDLACYQKNGNIYFLGRIDRQVKIRGFRIELGEIETILSQHSEIRQAVVTTINLTGENQTLIAYIVPEKQPFNEVIIKDYLKQKIPNYMIPSFFTFLTEFPLTANGKINYQALPLSDLIYSKTSQIHIKPQTELELRLVNIWEQVLNVNSISLQDNFFDLGGHSLLAMRILAKIEQEFKINLPLSNFLQTPTVESLVKQIKNQENLIEESSVVIINNQGNNLPLFFINSIRQAKKIGDYLDKNQPFYILNILGITEFLKPQLNSLKLEDIAAKFIEDMQTIQPHGPYFLIAYCADSFLTFEMAQQLQARGEKIAFLGFIDAIWGDQDIGVYLHWYNLRQFGLNYLIEMFKTKLFWTQERWMIRLRNWQGKLFSNNNKSLPRYIEDVRLLKAFELARNQYSPQSYSGKVTLFISQEYRLLHPSQLESLVTEGVEILEIPGYHHTLFKDPYVQILVQKIQTYIK